MNDDWRVQVTCPTTATAANLAELLRDGGFEHSMQDAAGERVIASLDGHELFLYAGTRAQAEKAAEAVKALAAPSGVSIRTELRRWHPASEEWADADLPLPESERAVAEEHAELIAEEREESQSLHFSEYEVRVGTQSHRDTLELAGKLRADGIPSLRRWRYLLIGTADEDAAKALAERIRTIAPAGSTIEVEASLREVEQETPANPFAIFGGLGG
ncbi:MAG TPA: hypothetical protein VHV75_09260 [Solirubrobacteraceae bacterium]|jgi:hypothetical protein|nr:hypothetical protein [Solirubrobacteraceae bacterium]